MSEPKLISPMLDNFLMGDPISDHAGVRCCPAMMQDTEERYIVKIISNPATQQRLEALLLTGAYPDAQSAKVYFKELSDDVVDEINIINTTIMISILYFFTLTTPFCYKYINQTVGV